MNLHAVDFFKLWNWTRYQEMINGNLLNFSCFLIQEIEILREKEGQRKRERERKRERDREKQRERQRERETLKKFSFYRHFTMLDTKMDDMGVIMF